MKFFECFFSKSFETSNEKDLSFSSDNHRKLEFKKHVVKQALKNAIKSREFEIQMYWKRASYFWLFVSTLWVAYGKLLYDWGYLDGSFKFNQYNHFSLYQYSTLFVLSCVGFGLSVAWYFVNKGSKFWQENWEFQINLLENEIIGPSYKTILSEKDIKDRSFFKQSLLGSFPYSVSKINVSIAFSSAILWLLSSNIWVVQLTRKIFATSCWLLSNIVFTVICMLFVYVFSKLTKSSFKKHDADDFNIVLKDEQSQAELIVHQRIL